MNWNEIETRLNVIPRLFTPSLAMILWEAAKALPDGGVILEIGAYKGYTTCALGYACLGTRKHVWTIDTFGGNPDNTNLQNGASYYDEFWKNVGICGLNNFITPLVGLSEQFYADWKRPIDLLFIDGNHETPFVQNDLTAFFPHLVSGGWLYMHDHYLEAAPPEDRADDPSWFGVPLQLTNIGWSLNLAWGRKR